VFIGSKGVGPNQVGGEGFSGAVASADTNNVVAGGGIFPGAIGVLVHKWCHRFCFLHSMNVFIDMKAGRQTYLRMWVSLKGQRGASFPEITENTMQVFTLHGA
jgi:hypothetical protein